ncbi:MAG TPA: phospho-N-acetylmuramoyl-pentapeptide-transferase [Mycobacteriales bacterium]|nr:phospho-N-acetylmuramoyl-pentapeptide-transferase [Mycobacteriales bacterium]
MRSVLVAALVSLLVSILCTPIAIRIFRREGFGQAIRDDGPQSHMAKRGTPTMGGTVIIVATLVGYFAAHLLSSGSGPSATGLLLLYLFTGMGVVGFLDDFIKIRKQRSLGLSARTKLVGQLVIGISFAVLALRFKDKSGLTPASVHLSYVRDIPEISFGAIFFVVFAYIVISGTSNGVNLTDGLDGLAAGSTAMVFGAYTAISFYQFRNACETLQRAGCYEARDPLDTALIAASAMAACFGFLWWNAAPARIFMGDTGSLALGGLVAGIAIVSRTELLLIVLGGLFVVETLSVMLQVAVFKTRRKRLFKMAPFHHHFELAGWAETTVIVRFWIIAGLAVAFGLGLFYAEFISYGLPG